MSFGLEKMKQLHPLVANQLSELMNAIIDLTIRVEKKQLNNINKQFQDCIMNYFFEDFVGDLIKAAFPSCTKTQIKENFMDETMLRLAASPEKLKKFMILPQVYIEEVKKQNKEDEYVEMLSNIILEEPAFNPNEARWKSQIRKKTFAVLLLVHYYNDCPVQSIFQMWSCAYPMTSIKNQKSKFGLKSVDSARNSPSEAEQSRKRKLIVEDVTIPLPTKRVQYDHYSKMFNSQFQKSMDNNAAAAADSLSHIEIKVQTESASQEIKPTLLTSQSSYEPLSSYQFHSNYEETESQENLSIPSHQFDFQSSSQLSVNQFFGSKDSNSIRKVICNHIWEDSEEEEQEDVQFTHLYEQVHFQSDEQQQYYYRQVSSFPYNSAAINSQYNNQITFQNSNQIPFNSILNRNQQSQKYTSTYLLANPNYQQVTTTKAYPQFIGSI